MCETRKIKVKQKEKKKRLKISSFFETKRKNSLGKTIFGQSKSVPVGIAFGTWRKKNEAKII